jgi:hypothetical protein
MVKEGIASADRGEFVPQDEMEEWLASWGTDHELPPDEPADSMTSDRPVERFCPHRLD